jgi:hypothetical protein
LTTLPFLVKKSSPAEGKGAQFTRFASTKVQILTQQALRGERAKKKRDGAAVFGAEEVSLATPSASVFGPFVQVKQVN